MLQEHQDKSAIFQCAVTFRKKKKETRQNKVLDLKLASLQLNATANPDKLATPRSVRTKGSKNCLLSKSKKGNKKWTRARSWSLVSSETSTKD